MNERMANYLNGETNEAFEGWMLELDAECEDRFDLSVFDLEDCLWRSHFDDGLEPGEALDYEIEAGSFTGLGEYDE
jgi:hypothetical protein